MYLQYSVCLLTLICRLPEDIRGLFHPARRTQEKDGGGALPEGTSDRLGIYISATKARIEDCARWKTVLALAPGRGLALLSRLR